MSDSGVLSGLDRVRTVCACAAHGVRLRLPRVIFDNLIGCAVLRRRKLGFVKRVRLAYIIVKVRRNVRLTYIIVKVRGC